MKNGSSSLTISAKDFDETEKYISKIVMNVDEWIVEDEEGERSNNQSKGTFNRIKKTNSKSMKFHLTLNGKEAVCSKRIKNLPDTFLFDENGFKKHFSQEHRCKKCEKVLKSIDFKSLFESLITFSKS